MAAISLLHIVERLRALRGMRRVAAAFAIGAAGALAFPPICLFPVLALCFPALIVLLQGAVSLRAAFLIGWSFAFGYLVAGLYWTAASMFVDIRTFWWAVPLALAVLPALFALYYGVAAALAWRIGLRGTAGALTVALLWFVADYARGHLFTGFPWNLEGYACESRIADIAVRQCHRHLRLDPYNAGRRVLAGRILDGKRHRMALLCAAVALVFIAAWGEGRLNNASNETVPDVRLSIVQPDVDQARKWLPSERDKNFRELSAYTSATGARPITHIVWPERLGLLSGRRSPASPCHRRCLAARRFVVTAPSGVSRTARVARAFTIPLSRSTMTGISPATTNSIWCRLANIFRCARICRVPCMRSCRSAISRRGRG